MDEIRKIMLGHVAYNIELVIITPLKSTFKSLIETQEIEEIYEKAFFVNCIFKINEKKGLIVLAPQGIASKDIIELFENTNILFFGLAGSLNPKFKIGDFVEVETAANEENKNLELVTTDTLRKVKCGYSPCLLGTMARNFCDFAKEMDCDVIDMETAYCAKTANKRNNKFTSLLLISDIPGLINFWEVSEEFQKKLKKGRIDAISKIVNYINILVRKE